MAAKSVKKTVKEAARMGKGRDNTLGHLATGEVVLPLDFQNKFPAVGAALRQAFEKAGIDYDQFVVGSSKNRINPRTGAPMFDDGGGGDGGGGDGGGEGGGEGGGGEGGGEGGGGEAGGSDDGGSGSASAGEGAGADEGGGGFGGYGGGWGGYGDSGDAAGYSGEAGAAMGDAAAGAGYGSTGSTGDEGSAGSTGDQGAGPAGGPSAGEMGGDPNPDIPAGDPMEGSLPGQTAFNAMMDGLLGAMLSGTQVGDPTADDVRGGYQGFTAPSQDRADELAREDAINALREDVARNEEIANTMMANQAAQEAAAAAAAAAANQSVYGTLADVGPSAWNTSTVSSGYGATGVTGAGTPGLGTGDYGVSGTTDSQVASTTSTGDRGGYTSEGNTSDEGVVSNVAQAETLSELPTTEIANAPSIFDLAALDNLAGKANEEDGFYSGQTTGGGDDFRRLTEEEQVVAAQLAQLAQAGQQQASVAPTVTPVQYDISKFISGIGSLATSKQA